MSAFAIAFAIALSQQPEPELRTPSIYRCPAEEGEGKFFESLIVEHYFDQICIEPAPGPKAKELAAGKVKFVTADKIDTEANRKWRDATIDFANGKISPKKWVERTKDLKETVHWLSNPKTPKLRDATSKVSYRATFAEMLVLSLPGVPCFTADDIGQTRYLPEDDVEMSWVLAMNDYLGPMMYYRTQEPYMVTGKIEIIRADEKPGILAFKLAGEEESLTFYFNNAKDPIKLSGIDEEKITIARGIEIDEEGTLTLPGWGSFILNN